MRYVATTFLALLGAGMWGCEEPHMPLPPLSYESTHVKMGVEGDAVPCGGTLPWMDHHVELLGALFERSVDDIIIDYYWLRQESLAPDCGAACTRTDTVIHSSVALLEHEIVHSVVAKWVGWGDSFFSEGVAVAAGSRIYGTYESSEFDDIQQMIGADRSSEVDYPTAGAFVTYLIERWGAPTFLEFYGHTTPEASYAAVDGSFEAVYGESLEDTIADFRAAGSGCVLLLPECGLDPVAWTDERWLAKVNLDCGGDSLGPPYGPEIPDAGAPWNYVAVDIPEPGNYLIASDGPPVSFHHCGPCLARDDSHESSSFGEVGVEAALLAGRYVARIDGLRGVSVDLTLSIEPVTP